MEYLINSKGNPWIFGYVFFGGGLAVFFEVFGGILGGV